LEALTTNKTNTSKNNSNKSQKIISLNPDTRDSFKNRIHIDDYELLKPKNNFNSNLYLEEPNNQKIYTNLPDSYTSTIEKYCGKAENNLNERLQEEIIYKQLINADDNTKYAVYNNSYINTEEYCVYNFSNIYEKYMNSKLANDIKRKNITDHLKDKIFDLLFKSNFNFILYKIFKINQKSFKLIEPFDANHLWKNDLIFNNESIIKFLRENNIIDNNYNISDFQYIDLNRIYNLLINNHLVKSIAGLFKERKKFKINFDAHGVDKFGNKKKMLDNFLVEIKYSFE